MHSFVAVARKDKNLGDIIDNIIWVNFLSGGQNMAWFYLVIAGIFEIIWAMGLKYSHGFTKLTPSLVTFGGMIASFYFLSLATKTLPIGTAYAVWTGIGALGAVLLGILLFKEPLSVLRIAFLCCILVGIIGLKVTSAN